MSRRGISAAYAPLAGLAVLLFAAIAIECASSPAAEGLTAPVDDADRRFKQLSVGRLVTCGVTMAGYIRCWGNTLFAPVRSDMKGYAEVVVTTLFTCGRRDNGVVDCWSGHPNYRPVPPTVRDGEPVTFSSISAGQRHVCGIQDGQHSQTEGLLKCWTDGRLGTIGKKRATIPTALATITFGAVGVGPDGTCALVKGGVDDGKAKCWGLLQRYS